MKNIRIVDIVDEYIDILVVLLRCKDKTKNKTDIGCIWSHLVKNSDISINLKQQVFNRCILPVVGFETKAVTKKYTNNLRTI